MNVVKFFENSSKVMATGVEISNGVVITKIIPDIG